MSLPVIRTGYISLFSDRGSLLFIIWECLVTAPQPIPILHQISFLWLRPALTPWRKQLYSSTYFNISLPRVKRVLSACLCTITCDLFLYLQPYNQDSGHEAGPEGCSSDSPNKVMLPVNPKGLKYILFIHNPILQSALNKYLLGSSPFCFGFVTNSWSLQWMTTS